MILALSHKDSNSSPKMQHEHTARIDFNKILRLAYTYIFLPTICIRAEGPIDVYHKAKE